MMKYVVLITLLFITVCDGGRSCLSCSGVEGSYACLHHITCNDNEVCYTHHFSTESGKDNFDFGCALKQVCPTSVSAFVGKRSEGHHSLCYRCCNDSDFCNQNLQCNTATAPTASSAHVPAECSDITPTISTSGVYTIYPFGIRERPVHVNCIVQTGGRIWTVIQQRFNGSVNFYRDWDSYKQGFGSPYGEYWLGNEIIHVLTSSYHHELMINMSDFEGEKRYEEYKTFHLGDETNGYILYVTDASGDAGDDLTYHTGNMFSTYDKDNDRWPNNCASVYKGAWWYNACVFSDLNGEYLYGHSNSGRGVYWDGFRGRSYSLKSTLLMIRKLST